MLALAGQSGYLAIESMSAIEPPWRASPKEKGNKGDFQVSEWLVQWGGGG